MEKQNYQIRCLYMGQKTYLPKHILEQMGIGNCQECTYDPENNKKCKLYYPIPIRTFEVKENNLEKKSKSL